MRKSTEALIAGAGILETLVAISLVLGAIGGFHATVAATIGAIALFISTFLE